MDAFGEDPYKVVLQRLDSALGAVTGKLRALDALKLAGFPRPNYRRSRLVSRALSELGWERGRFRFSGTLLYAYARGTQIEREVTLDVTRVDDQLAVKRRMP